MLGEHQVITRLVREVTDAAEPVRAAATATALRAVFDSHLTKENDLILPLLAASPRHSVAELLGDLHELLGPHPGSAAAEEATGGCGGHTCA